jgi:endonuclease-8
MPEGPEIRRAADRLARALVGTPLLRVTYHVPALRRRARALRGASVVRVHARSKALLIEFDCGLTHYSHNQLYGRWEIRRATAAARVDRQARVGLVTARHVATLYSATDIALLDAAALAQHPYLSRRGPDVLDPALTAAALRVHIAQPRFARAALATLLLDQGFIAGLGNYLRSEILFAARLPVTARIARLTPGQIAALARAAIRLSRQSYRARGVTNDLPQARALRDRGVAYDDYRFLVYDRAGQPCRTCGAAIQRIDLAGRGLFHCPSCQDSAK